MFGIEKMFDLNRNGRMEAAERATMFEFLSEVEKRSERNSYNNSYGYTRDRNRCCEDDTDSEEDD